MSKQTRFFPGRYYVVDNDILLVAASGLTTQEVAQGLGISDEVGGVVQRGIVIAVLAYWGYHDKPLWEWMAVKERAGVY